MGLPADILAGFALTLAAAAMNGAYAVPLKLMRAWRWEQAWLVFTMIAMWVLPPVVGFTTIPNLRHAYGQVASVTLIAMGSLGILWGLGVLLIGMAFPLVGVAVGNAVALGSAAALGSLLPLFGQRAGAASTSAGQLILAGVALLLLGVSLCGLAGRDRERRQGSRLAVRGKALPGFVLAFAGGSLTAGLNIAVAYGEPVLRNVRAAAPGNAWAADAIWIPVLLGGALPGVLYCARLIRRNAPLKPPAASAAVHDWLLTFLMSILWFGSVLLYGVSVLRLGALGAIVGWPVFMSGAVLASFGWGALAGEWKGSGARPRLTMLAGIALLVLAMGLFAQAASVH